MSREAITIVPLHPEHWNDVVRIYADGISTGDATFETEVPTWETWDETHLSVGRLVARKGGEVVGWAALGRVSGREVYGGVAEVSVYVRQDHRSQGVGSLLLRSLIRESERGGIWTLQAGIFPENTGSLRLHKRSGFREVGLRERIGQLRGRWRDLLLLERRSSVVGTAGTSSAVPGSGGIRST
jgi:L-amino acid N-acyltransferase YncA